MLQGESPLRRRPKGFPIALWKPSVRTLLFIGFDRKFLVKALPHNSSAALAMPFLQSAACKFLDLPPVNLRNLHLHLMKKSIRQPTTSFVRCYLNIKTALPFLKTGETVPYFDMLDSFSPTIAHSEFRITYASAFFSAGWNSRLRWYATASSAEQSIHPTGYASATMTKRSCSSAIIVVAR